jgi:hypothetical protein
MPKTESLDELIAQKAAEFADQIKHAAQMADKEEEIRIEAERQLAFIEKATGIKLEGRHEFTVASGRVDSVYDRVIIEYKNPKSPGARIGPKADSAGSKKVVEQIKKRFYDMQTELGHPLNTMFGVGLDGNYFIFIRYRDKKWHVQDPVEVNKYSSETFLWALYNLGQHGRPFSPEYLAGDFGADSPLAQSGVRALYEAISATEHPKAQVFFNQWRILFGEVCGYDVDSPSTEMAELAKSYGIEHRRRFQPAQLLFAVHTYYALFMKLLASSVVTFFRDLPTPLAKMVQAVTSNKLKTEVEELERGSVFRHFNITNFLEGDLFAWYTAVWSEPIEKLVRDMVARLDSYNPGTMSEDRVASRDLLKKLYQQLFPQSVRHNLGEYYTPDWLAEHVLNGLDYNGNPDKRLLDPGCGSGTFLVMAINRIRKWYDENRERCRLDEGDLCRKILSNVVGFDLNPVAIMAARTNYLIAIRDLTGYVDKVEIPVYLCDSVVTAAEYGDLFKGDKGAQVPCSARKPPYLIVPKEIAQNSEHVAQYANVIERSLLIGNTAEQFINECIDQSLPMSDRELHLELYSELLGLHNAQKNGVWARIIKNSFAPLFVGEFDFVAGNPPWVNWESLPADYRAQTENIWKHYKLMGPIPTKKRQQSDKAKTDISILMTYVAADKYLKRGGRLGFVITRSVFQSELGGWHFRRFRLPNLRPLSVDAINDFDSIKPFRRQAANVTCVMTLTSDVEPTYPVPWISWRSRGRNKVEQDTDYAKVLTETEQLDWIATPIDKHQLQSPWLFGEEHAVNVLLRIIGPSYYAKYVREGINTRGANGVYFLDAQLSNGKLFIRNRALDGDDPSLPVVEQTIEADYVFPLLRGKDVSRWFGKPGGFILMPHSEDAPTSPVPFDELPDKTQEFLHRFKAKLAGRKKFRNFDPAGSEWYGCYSVLNATFAPFKVVWREMASGSVAAVVADADLPSGKSKIVIPDHKLFIIPCVSAEEANFVCGIFNSSLANYLIRSYALATGISTHIFDRLAIPAFDSLNDLHIRISTLAANCHDEVNLGRDVSGAEDELNKLVDMTFALAPSESQAIRLALATIS